MGAKQQKKPKAKPKLEPPKLPKQLPELEWQSMRIYGAGRGHCGFARLYYWA
ncbi:hypothetical protein [Paenibacillus sp. MMS18-CY102]|uniref:hypothetical protein n=1 Tax=Paenibacillus sp. MMS18-CY102 TaxID=2682849 RepID=UPI0013657F44|nr:hypothetical protein [Paenibacillus sp. MMS18-CY102]MWC30711.1 hypothetical protein [Paenibacillus sp. MMS18-CY102]